MPHPIIDIDTKGRRSIGRQSYVQLPQDDFDVAIEQGETPQKGRRRSQLVIALEVDAAKQLDGLTEEDVANGFSFVEAGWFQIIAALMILSNTIMIVIEADTHTTSPSIKKVIFYASQVTLCFYILELVCRIGFFHRNFLGGPAWLVAWNVLDVIVVVAGILDQWVLSALPVETVGNLKGILTFFRLLRLVRVLKIIRIFWETDLSWTEEAEFQSFIGGIIGLNALLMGAETDIKWEGWVFIEQALLFIYVFELSCRLKRFGLSFLNWNNPDFTWNLLDFIIVVSSVTDSWLIPICTIVKNLLSGDNEEERKRKAQGMSMGQVMMLMRMLRLMRILRLVKLIKSVRPLFILVTGVVAALQGVAWVLVLTIVTLYAMGLMATRLIGHKMLFPDNADVPDSVIGPFKTVSDSMFTLFRVMSGAQSNDEAAAIDYLTESLPTFKFAFVFFMITSSWTLLSILTAVVSENMISTTGAQEEEFKICSAEEDRAVHIGNLKEMFSIMDLGGDGRISKEELIEFCKDRNNALMCAKLCRVPVRDVVEVFKTLSRDGEPIAMDDFVEPMAEVGRPVTEKSVMKIEAHLLTLKETVKQISEKLEENFVSAGAFGRMVKGYNDQLEVVRNTIQSLDDRHEALERKLDDWQRTSLSKTRTC